MLLDKDSNLLEQLEKLFVIRKNILEMSFRGRIIVTWKLF